MVSRFITGAAATLATLSFAAAASAGCGGSTYCNSSSMSSLSSWNGATSSSYSTYGGSSSYSPSSSSYTTTMSPIQADRTYGTGSISQTYSENVDVEFFSGATNGVSGLGYNETLQSTSCPVGVMGTEPGSKVLGCYNVVQPVPQTTYYRVVRPVIYVRYPVPVAVPYTSPCHTRVKYSRYGDYGYRHAHAAHHGQHGYRMGCR